MAIIPCVVQYILAAFLFYVVCISQSIALTCPHPSPPPYGTTSFISVSLFCIYIICITF